MSVKKTVLLEDNVCESCGDELPKGSEVMYDDELKMIFCDKDCEEGWTKEHLGQGDDEDEL